MNNQLLDEAIKYFKENEGFKRCFKQIRKKYQSLGSLGGTIFLNKLTKQEQEALSGLFGRDYHHQKSAKIHVNSFEKALKNTRFEELSFIDIVEGYFGEHLMSKREVTYLYATKKEHFFDQIIKNHEGTYEGVWLNNICKEKNSAYRLISNRYDIDPKKLNKDLLIIFKALSRLRRKNATKERLPIFASNITTNPHGFDEGTDLHTLLLYGITDMLDVSIPKNAEEKAELFYKAGILIDELSNYTLLTGLLGYCSGKVHSGWKGFYENREPLQVSLSNLSKIEKVVSPCNKVYVVENPTVFSSILDYFGNNIISLVCTYGQVKLASLVLMDLLIKDGAILYYSGDFDPEGLLIADRLKERYGEKLVLWGYTLKNYTKCKSIKKISESRLKKLRNLKNNELNELGNILIREKLAGYQELIITELIDDIK